LSHRSSFDPFPDELIAHAIYITNNVYINYDTTKKRPPRGGRFIKTLKMSAFSLLDDFYTLNA